MKITYEDKVALNENPEVDDINKFKADDINEIKKVVNANYEDVGDIANLNTEDMSSIVNAINEINENNANKILYTVTEPVNSVSFDVNIKKNERYKIIINGALNTQEDLHMLVNDITVGYYTTAFSFNGSNNSEGTLSAGSAYRPNKGSFYWYHTLATGLSSIVGYLSLTLNAGTSDYYPMYNYTSYASTLGKQYITKATGFVTTNVDAITKITFSTNSTSNRIKSGTTFEIIKDN